MRRVPWIALALVLSWGAGFALASGVAAGWVHVPPCPFKAITGLPCASCGLTRWGLALARGDWRGALHWHPVATVLAFGSPLAALWDLARAWRGRPYPALPDSGMARGSALALFVLAWLLQAIRGI